MRENLDLADPASFPLGSSPRVRGKLPFDAQDGWVLGLIPACAGKNASTSALVGGWRAHPRVCGGNPDAEMDERIWEGSSPRVRGKLAPQGHLPEVPRLIPACAGKTAAVRTPETG